MDVELSAGASFEILRVSVAAAEDLRYNWQLMSEQGGGRRHVPSMHVTRLAS